MNDYVDITLLPDTEIPATVLMNAIYTKLHQALHDLSSNSIGVSFPKYKVTLGNILRIHGEKSILCDLFSMDWIGGMRGYCEITEIQSIPQDAKFRTVFRKHVSMSESKLRRLISRGSLADDRVRHYRAKMFSKGLDNPYVELISASNGHKHRRYIVFGELVDYPTFGAFDQFGLSKTATVPWFD